MSSKKVFSEQTKSKLNELYNGSYNAVLEKRAVLNTDDYGSITFTKIIDKLKVQPFVSTVNKSAHLNWDKINFDEINTTVKNLRAIPKSKESAVIEIVKIHDIPEVKFMPSEFVTVGNKKRLAAPRLSINLSNQKISARCGVRINTGYVVKMNTVAVGKTQRNDKIMDTVLGRQPDFFVVPQIVSSHDGLIQCLYGRDPEDTGLLTVNFTTTKDLDTSKPLLVVLNAYTIERPMQKINLLDRESTSEIFKPKDNHVGRWIKNPKIKFYADKFDTETIPGSLILNTIDITKNPSNLYEKQKIKIDNVITLFTSRKREWCDPHLISFAGIYNPIFKKNSPGMISTDVDVKNNIHCMAFIKSQITLYSIYTPFQYDCRILNGAFYNYPSYSDINRDIRRVTSSLENLEIGAKICNSIKLKNPESEYNVLDLLRVFDYDRSISSTDNRLPKKLLNDDEKLFSERPADLHCYSVILYKGLKSLARLVMGDKPTENDITDGSNENATAATADAAKNEQSNLNDQENVDTIKHAASNQDGLLKAPHDAKIEDSANDVASNHNGHNTKDVESIQNTKKRDETRSIQDSQDAMSSSNVVAEELMQDSQLLEETQSNQEVALKQNENVEVSVIRSIKRNSIDVSNADAIDDVINEKRVKLI